MCVINITLNTTTPNGTTIVSSNGRYRKVGNTNWVNFVINLNTPKTPPITTLGLYDLQVNVTNNVGVTSDWALGTFEISTNCGGTFTNDYTGVWERDDPAHPFGGQVRYLDANGVEQLIQYIWMGDCVTITATQIIQTIGVRIGCD